MEFVFDWVENNLQAFCLFSIVFSKAFSLSGSGLCSKVEYCAVICGFNDHIRECFLKQCLYRKKCWKTVIFSFSTIFLCPGIKRLVAYCFTVVCLSIAKLTCKLKHFPVTSNLTYLSCHPHI